MLDDRLLSDAICSCYATELISTGQKRPGLVTITIVPLTMAHSQVYSLRPNVFLYQAVKNVYYW